MRVGKTWIQLKSGTRSAKVRLELALDEILQVDCVSGFLETTRIQDLGSQTKEISRNRLIIGIQRLRSDNALGIVDFYAAICPKREHRPQIRLA
jgi:hypothetical protein